MIMIVMTTRVMRLRMKMMIRAAMRTTIMNL
jgi:hypothetical protein